MLRFNSAEDAYRYWDALGGEGQHFDDWVEDQGITWLSEEDQEFIRSFE